MYTRRLARKFGLDQKALNESLSNPEIIKKLYIDLKEGLKLGITGTPGYIIDGKVYLGTLPPELHKNIFR